MGSSPARLVIALSVAAALAVFVVYTALAGNGVADLTPSTVTSHTGAVSLVGKVVGKAQPNDAYTTAGMRFSLKDVQGKNVARVPVVYHGSVPDGFKTGADLIVQGNAAERRLRGEAGLDAHQVPGSLRREIVQDLS